MTHRQGISVAVIVVTRLRLRDPAVQDQFFTDAVAAIEQAQKAEGNLGVDALADANNAWWSVSYWEEGSPDLPDWQTSHRHLVADGQAAELTHPSDANQTRAFPPPVVPAGP